MCFEFNQLILMLKKIKQNPQKSYFFLYLWAYGLYGSVIAVPGPVIPYMAVKYQLPETTFKFMFWTRGFGFILGGFLSKILNKFFKFHTLIAFAMIVTSIAFMIFPFTFSISLQGLEVFIGALGCSIFQILNYSCLMEAFKGNQQDYWLQLCLVPFGIFALASPVLVSFIGEMSYFVVGFCFFLSSFLYFLLQSPQSIKHQHLIENHDEEMGIKIISKKTQYILGFMIFFYFAQETGFGGWISSYSVMKDIFNKEVSASLVSLFWALMTIFRFIIAGINQNVQQKLKKLFYFRALGLFVSIILSSMGLQQISTLLSCILMGIAYSSTYSFIVTLPLIYKKKISPNQAANITIFGTLGEGILTTFQGILMERISPNILFVYLLFIGFCNYLLFCGAVSSLKEKSPYQGLIPKEIELQKWKQTKNENFK